MSIYGGLLKEETYTPTSFFDLMESIYESNNEIDRMFERYLCLDELGLLTEDTLAIEDKGGASNPKAKFNTKEFAKKCADKIKELWDRFTNFVKTLFEKLQNNLIDFYNKTTLVDAAVRKTMADKMEYENLVKAKEGGWKGLSVNIPIITKLYDFTDHGFYNKYDSEFYHKCSPADIDEIIDAKDEAEAQEKYSEFSKKLKDFKSVSLQDTSFGFSSAESRRNIEADFAEIKLNMGLADEEDLDKIKEYKFKMHFAGPGPAMLSEDKKSYYPDEKAFGITKDIGENGQKRIREIKSRNRDMMKHLNQSKKTAKLDNLAFKESSIKAQTLYYKAKYEYASVLVQRYSRITRTVVQLVNRQYQIGFKTYIMEYNAIKKYAKLA